MKYKISEIFDLSQKTNNSSFTKEFVEKHKGTIPVYSASKEENIAGYGFIQDNIEGVKYFENCLTFNFDGAVGNIFYRQGKFSLSEKVIPLIPNEKFKICNLIYLKYAVENEIKNNGFCYTDKAGKTKIADILVYIPTLENEDFDLVKQEQMVNKFVFLDEVKKKIEEYKLQIDSIKLIIQEQNKTSDIKLSQLFTIKKGDSKYTKEYINKNKGNYPVYSSQTTSEGIIGSINTYDYDCKCITWTTDGTYVGTTFLRKGKFSMTTHCGGLLLKEEYKNTISLEYVNYLLNNTLSFYKVGEGSNKRLGATLIKDITIKIPVLDNGEFDIKKQIEIAEKYRKIEEIKANIKNELDKISNVKIDFGI